MSKENKIQDQPPPRSNSGRPVWEMVVEDMQERDRVGRERYGTPLQAGNGRDALVDAYQEALDLAVYLRQAIEERDGPAVEVEDMELLLDGGAEGRVVIVDAPNPEVVVEEPGGQSASVALSLSEAEELGWALVEAAEARKKST